MIDQNIEKLKYKKINLKNKKANIKIIQCDIGSLSDLSQLIKNDLKNVNHIDVLINNAGVDSFQKFEDVDEISFDYLNNINGKGSFFLTQKLYSKIKKIKICINYICIIFKCLDWKSKPFCLHIH